MPRNVRRFIQMKLMLLGELSLIYSWYSFVMNTKRLGSTPSEIGHAPSVLSGYCLRPTPTRETHRTSQCLTNRNSLTSCILESRSIDIDYKLYFCWGWHLLRKVNGFYGTTKILKLNPFLQILHIIQVNMIKSFILAFTSWSYFNFVFISPHGICAHFRSMW